MSKVRKVNAQELVKAAESLVSEDNDTSNSKNSVLGNLSAIVASNIAGRFGTDEEGNPIEKPIEKLDAMVSNTLFDDFDTDSDTYASIENVYRSNLVYDLVDWYYDNSEKFTENDKNTPYVKAGEFFTLENPETGVEAINWESDTARTIASAALLGLSDTQTRNSAVWLAMVTTEIVEGGGDSILTAMLTAAFIHDLNNSGEISESTGTEVFDALKNTLTHISQSRDFDWRSDMIRSSSRNLNKAILQAKRNYRDFIEDYDASNNKSDVTIDQYFSNSGNSTETLFAIVATYAFMKETGKFSVETPFSEIAFVNEVVSTLRNASEETIASTTTAAYVTFRTFFENNTTGNKLVIQ